jgi:ABC-type polysaccharide/polyol phosphate transport system ATPase subunit
MTLAVKFENVSKRYHRGHAPSLREDTVRAALRAVGRAAPLPIVNALRDASFEIDCGANLALMGANGSGKTTALKLMSRVTWPSAGRVHVRGRIGALMEVGTGMHPELTGRENIWLYGRILGLRRRDIARRFDSIVDFADIGQALDQPVKQFSSGMHVRLGFALASHLEPDILIIDEAVSVGDARFQRRCVQKIAQMHESGVTLVFVSHIPSLVAALCNQGIYLRDGSIIAHGPIGDIVEQYLADSVEAKLGVRTSDDVIRVRSWDYELIAGKGRSLGGILLRFQLRLAQPLTDPRFLVAIGRQPLGTLIGCDMHRDGFTVGTVAGDIEVQCEIEDLPLEAGEYDIRFVATSPVDGTVLLGTTLLGYISLDRDGTIRPGAAALVGSRAQPAVRVPYRWQVTAQPDHPWTEEAARPGEAHQRHTP